MPDYAKTLDELAKSLGVDIKTGRTKGAAAAALAKHGDNVLTAKERLNALQKFLVQLKDPMVLILIAAAVISFAVAAVEETGEYIDSVIILSIVVLNGVLGVVQESRAEKSLDALKAMAAPAARVLREGTVSEIPSSQIVPGDVILLEAGGFIPADARLIEAASLKCDESALTGESEPSEKNASAVVEEGSALGDRHNMVYSGCTVSYGRAKALVTATGMETEIGRIAGLLNSAENEPTPLQQRLTKLGKNLGILALIICAMIFLIGVSRKMDIMVMFMTSVSLAVAAIPEGLTAVVTIVLALGVQRMVKKNAIIRKLPAVETLGSASVICSDKTGTLTQNRMTVMKVWVPGSGIADMDANVSGKVRQLLMLGALCNDGAVETDGDTRRFIGDPTETAIVAASELCGQFKSELDRVYPRIAEIPFDSARKLMTTIHEVNGKLVAVVKGGYDKLLPLCVNADGQKADEINARMAKTALRVLAVACRELDALPEEVVPEIVEKDLMFMGLIGMLDPPREESKHAVERCHGAGIKTVMITGDHIATASAIARELGILKDDSQAISGAELAKLYDDELEDNIDKYRVYARVSPEDKIRIVNAWQERGDVVAMTGDGVNDAPALKAADIGCAMGITGTDVSKEAADMVLTDDNFATIVDAVEAGRGIYDNIKKTVHFLLGSNLGEIFVVLAAVLFGWGAPLLAIHLLLVNVVTDTFPALALGVEPTDADVMRRRPIPRGHGIFSGGLGLAIMLSGIMVGLITLAGYCIGSFAEISAAIPASHETGVTTAFLTLAFSQLIQALNCRSSDSIFKIGLFSSKPMIQAFLASSAIILLITLVPALAAVFRLTALSREHWLVVVGLSVSPLVIVEIAKFVTRKFLKKK